MIGWLNDINRLVSKDKREPRVIPAENTHTLTLALRYTVGTHAGVFMTCFDDINAGDISIFQLQREIACFH